MGEIYLGKNPGVDGIGKLLAIKKIRPEFTLDPEMVRLFRREAQVAIKLNHTNIASIYEFGMADGSFFLAMEFIAGTSLDNIFQRAKGGVIHLGPQDAINIVLAAASALAYAHRFVDPETQKATPVVHRDVSPHNILVSYEGEVKLIDFGIARMEGNAHHTQPGSVMGKVVYMAPEQLRGEKIDHRADLYALGIIFWELLTATRYYQGLDNAQIRQKLLDSTGPMPLPDTLPHHEQFNKFLQKLMAPAAQDRYVTAEAFVADLQMFYNQNFPGHSQMNLRTLLQEAYLDDIRELKRRLAKYSQQAAKDAAPADVGNDATQLATPTPSLGAMTPSAATQTAPRPGMTGLTATGFTRNEEALRKLVEDVVSTRVTAISSVSAHQQQSKWMKYAKFRYLWGLAFLLFLGNFALNQSFRTRFIENSKVLRTVYHKIFDKNENIHIVTSPDGRVVGVQVGNQQTPPPNPEPLPPPRQDIVLEMNTNTNTNTKTPPPKAQPQPSAQSYADFDVEDPPPPPELEPESKSRPVAEGQNGRVPTSTKTGRPEFNDRKVKDSDEYRVFVDSEPRGADIYIDGLKFEFPTPTYIKFKNSKSFRLELRKKGYKRYMELTSPTADAIRPHLSQGR